MPLSAGDKLGPYEILAPIGAGGMGEVYRARDPRLNREIAIKVSAEHFSDRFANEARAVAALNHPHICQIYDVGPNYLVMELVEGKPLTGPTSLGEAVRLGIQIADALEEAHRRGVLHRDLKPANIMVTGKGSVKLLDFGLAKLVDQLNPNSTITMEGTVMGTAAYMSPEQAQGKPLDQRGDVVSFGAVLYELISGRHAFPGSSRAEVISAVLRDQPSPLPVPLELAAIVKRCLHKSPAGRFQTVAELKAALIRLGDIGASTTGSYPSIAVLPFTNVSGDKDNEYFSDGLAEEIINALTKISGLKVAARTSAFAFKGRSEDIRLIGQTLGVAHILEGSVRKAGNRVRITAELIAVADGCHLWSERYDREMTDIFAIQDDIAQAIVSVLKKFTRPGHQIVQRPTTSLAAHQAYLEGMYYVQQYTAASPARSRKLFERAIELDPNYAAPHAGLAELSLYLTHYEAMPMEDVVPKALAAAERAIELDASAPEGYTARGFIRGACQYQWNAAGEDFDHALRLNPDSSKAHYRRAVWYLVSLGRMEEAVIEVQRAEELNPLSPIERLARALTLNFAGRNEDAVDRCRTVVEMFPAAFTTSLVAGLIFGSSGTLKEAEGFLEQGLQNAPSNLWLTAVQAAVYARQGKSEQVARIQAQLETLAKWQYVPAIVLGLVYVVAGDLNLGFKFLEKAVDEHQIWTACFLHAPLFVQFLEGPRHDALLRKMNMPVAHGDRGAA